MSTTAGIKIERHTDQSQDPVGYSGSIRLVERFQDSALVARDAR